MNAWRRSRCESSTSAVDVSLDCSIENTVDAAKAEDSERPSDGAQKI